MRAGGIEVVQRLRDAQIRIGVVVIGELFALMPQIGFDLEFRREGKTNAVTKLTAELRFHLLIGQVRDVADHACDAQAAARLGIEAVEIAAVKIGIGENRLARDLVEGNVLGGEIGRCCNHERVTDACGKARRPREGLHAAETAAHHGGPLLDAQSIREPCLRVDPVFDGDERKIGAVRLAGGRIDRLRAGRAEATAEIVDADHEETVGIERLARPDHVVPPADVRRIVGVVARHMMRCVQRVADQHSIVALAIQRAVGLVGELVLRQRAAAGERQRRVEACELRVRDADARRSGLRGLRRIGGDGGGGERRHREQQTETKNPTSGWLIGLAGIYP